MTKERLPKKQLSEEEKETFLITLKHRFEEHTHRHPEVEWKQVRNKLTADSTKMHSLYQMEFTGGEPDVIDYDENTGEFIFYDCSAESPKGRRSVCYDREALESRKKHKPDHSAMEMAVEMGIELLTEEQYRQLQELGDFDTKTSSWLKTPDEVRELGGAIFGDYRFGRTFIYHNGAESYYGARGFRGMLRV